MGGRPGSSVSGPAAASTELPCGWCGSYTRRGPFCETCGSPMPVVFISLASNLSEDLIEPEPDDAGVNAQGAAPEPDVPCTWCGFMSTAGPACDRCGSPLPTSYAMSQDGSLVATRKKKVPPVVTITPKGGVDPRAEGNGSRPAAEGEPAALDWEREAVVHQEVAPAPPVADPTPVPIVAAAVAPAEALIEAQPEPLVDAEPEAMVEAPP